MSSTTITSKKAREVRKEAPHKGADKGVAGLDMNQPYKVRFKIKGTADLLFNRLRPEVLEKPEDGKGGGKVKNTVVDMESLLYRCENGNIGLPAVMIKAAMKQAGSRFKDPQKSGAARCKQLFKEGVRCSSGHEIADLGVTDFIEDVQVGRNPNMRGAAVVIHRPLVRRGWEAEFEFDVVMPEVINETEGTKSINFYDILEAAGRCQGVGDYRPDYGTFRIVEYNIVPFSDTE